MGPNRKTQSNDLPKLEFNTVPSRSSGDSISERSYSASSGRSSSTSRKQGVHRQDAVPERRPSPALSWRTDASDSFSANTTPPIKPEEYAVRLKCAYRTPAESKRQYLDLVEHDLPVRKRSVQSDSAVVLPGSRVQSLSAPTPPPRASSLRLGPSGRPVLQEQQLARRRAEDKVDVRNEHCDAVPTRPTPQSRSSSRADQHARRSESARPNNTAVSHTAAPRKPQPASKAQPQSALVDSAWHLPDDIIPGIGSTSPQPTQRSRDPSHAIESRFLAQMAEMAGVINQLRGEVEHLSSVTNHLSRRVI